MVDGYQLSAEAVRDLRQKLRANQLRLQSLERNLAQFGSRRHQTLYAPPVVGRVKFRNDSGESVPPYSVMRVTGATTGTVPLLTIDKPNGDFYRHYLVNGSKAVAATKSGTGDWLDESAYVAVESLSAAFDETWGPKSGQWTLTQHRSGFHIKGGATTKNGVTVAIAVQQQVDLLIGKADAAIANGASGACSIWMGVAGSEADTGWNVTAYNRSEAIDADEWVGISCVHGQWYVSAIDCPAEEA